MGGLVGGSPAGAGGSGTGSHANVYTPTGQGAADQQYQSLISSIYGPYFAGTTPPQVNYPTAQAAAMNVGQTNPFAQQAIQDVQTAAFGGGGLPGEQSLANQLIGNLQEGGNTIANWAFNPSYQTLAHSYWTNPYYDQSLQGAQAAAGIGSQAAQIASNQLPMIAGLPSQLGGLAGQAAAGIPALQGLAGQAALGISPLQGLAGQVAAEMPAVQGLAGQVAAEMPAVQGLAGRAALGISPLQGAAERILQTGFDPQSALYNRTLQQVTDQANALNSMYGLASSPYGAGTAGNTLSNFNIDWQNQQLARQQAALGAASGAYGQAGGLAGTAGGLYGQAGALGGQAGNLYGQAGALGGQAGGLYGQAGALADATGNLYSQAGGLANTAGGLYGMIPNVAQSGLNLGSGATSLAALSAGLPSSVYTGNLDQEAKGIQIPLSAALQGIQGLNQTGAGYGLGTNMLTNAAMLPYNTSAGIAGQGIPALQQATTLGLQQYALPQQLMNDLQSYLGLGQAASGISGTLGNLGFNQGMQSAGGLGQLAGLGGNFLLGNQGLTGLLGINPQTGLLGNLFGGGAAGLTAADLALPADAAASTVPDLFSLLGTAGMFAL